MNKLSSEAKEFVLATSQLVDLASKNNIDIGVAPTYLSLATTKEYAPNGLIVAAQNVHFEDHGAFTGEVSIPMLKEFDIDWCLIGHSERRTYDNETSDKCNKKIKALIVNNMTPVYCVGETLAEFESGITKDVIKSQIEVGLKELSKDDATHLVIAYEPVWSIGTGKNASKEIAQDICKFIRDLLKALFGEVSDEIRILYGGSVKPINVKEYLTCPDVDGALVGGASLKVDSFKELLENIL